MFERFGEMSSCREINELAENLLNEGDIQSLKVMAQENGMTGTEKQCIRYRLQKRQ